MMEKITHNITLNTHIRLFLCTENKKELDTRDSTLIYACSCMRSYARGKPHTHTYMHIMLCSIKKIQGFYHGNNLNNDTDEK